MGASKRKQEFNNHVKNYVQAVFAERLLEEGFVSVENRDICWYRVKNDEIIDTICFFSPWNNIPVFGLCIGYGIHPLFTEPYYANSACRNKVITNKETFMEELIVEDGPTSVDLFSEDIEVFAPTNGGKGVYTFNELVLPQMQSVQTIEDCYALHKKKYFGNEFTEKRIREAYGAECSAEFITEIKFRTMSQLYIDEAIYMNDEELFPLCEKKVEERIALYREYCKKYPNNQEYKRVLNCYLQQRQVFLEHNRDAYLEILEERRKKNIAMLHKRFGI